MSLNDNVCVEGLEGSDVMGNKIEEGSVLWVLSYVHRFLIVAKYIFFPCGHVTSQLSQKSSHCLRGSVLGLGSNVLRVQCGTAFLD